jgi:hypothetical protein
MESGLGFDDENYDDDEKRVGENKTEDGNDGGREEGYMKSCNSITCPETAHQSSRAGVSVFETGLPLHNKFAM